MPEFRLRLVGGRVGVVDLERRLGGDRSQCRQQREVRGEYVGADSDQ